MEIYFSNLFEDVRHERSLFLLLSLTDPGILKQSKFTDYELNFIKNPALAELHRQKCLKEYFALQILDKNIIKNSHKITSIFVSNYIFCLKNEYISKFE